MADVKIRIIGEDKASKEVAKVDSRFDQLKKSAEGVAKPVGNIKSLFSSIAIAAGPAIAAGYAFKKAFDLSRAGAELELTAGKFDRLAISIGTTSDYLLGDLRRATKNTVSDMALVASATDFVSLGLAKNRDQVVRLTSVAGKLGMDMNQLVLTLTNQTTMRFDALGVSVDGFKERVDALKKSGLDANAAFTEAFLQQAEAQIERVGDVADTSAGKFMQLDAASENLANTWKLALAPDGVKVAGALTDALNAIADGEILLTKAELRARQAASELAEGMREAYYGTRDNIVALPVLAAKTNIAAEASKYLDSTLRASIMEDWERDAILGGDAARRFGGMVKEAGDKAEKAKFNVEDFWNAINTNITSDAQRALEQLEFKAAGGVEIDTMIQQTKDAIATGAITEAEGKRFLEGLFVAGVVLERDLGNINLWEAAEEIRSQLGIPMQEALDLVRKFKGEAKFDITSRVRIELEYDTGIGGGQIPEGIGIPVPRAGGAHGLNMIVPPGFPNDSFMVGATSGERVDITPTGKSGGGDMIVDITVIGSPGMSEAVLADSVIRKLAMAQRAWAGGRAYAG